MVLWDERSTTVTAISYLNATDTRGKKRKAVVDAVAATIILESYLGLAEEQSRILTPDESKKDRSPHKTGAGLF